MDYCANTLLRIFEPAFTIGKLYQCGPGWLTTPRITACDIVIARRSVYMACMHVNGLITAVEKNTRT